MPNHNTNNKKKKELQSNITMDEKHTQMLNEFFTVETDVIPDLEQQRLVLKNELHALDESDIYKKMEIKDQLQNIA